MEAQPSLGRAGAFVDYGTMAEEAEPSSRVAIVAAYREATRLLSMFDTALAGRDFCAGDRFTVGDIAMGVAVHRWVTLPTQFPHVLAPGSGLDAVSDWHRRISGRPAFKSAVG